MYLKTPLNVDNVIFKDEDGKVIVSQAIITQETIAGLEWEVTLELVLLAKEKFFLFTTHQAILLERQSYLQ